MYGRDRKEVRSGLFGMVPDSIAAALGERCAVSYHGGKISLSQKVWLSKNQTAKGAWSKSKVELLGKAHKVRFRRQLSSKRECVKCCSLCAHEPHILSLTCCSPNI